MTDKTSCCLSRLGHVTAYTYSSRNAIEVIEIQEIIVEEKADCLFINVKTYLWMLYSQLLKVFGNDDFSNNSSDEFDSEPETLAEDP